MNEERCQTYLNFLLQLLPAFLTGNPQVVYLYLEANLDKLDDGMVELFQSWTGVYSFIRANSYKLRIYLPTVSPDKAEILVATMIAMLCDTLVQFAQEGKASNIEIAIAGHKMIVNVFDRKTFSEEWTTTQISLGAAYRNRIKGDPAENLELSLEYYRNALEVYTPDASPIQWADIQNNLANIYRERIEKNPAVNQERAIACCCNALTIYFRFSRWEAWVRTQNNLALIYKERIWGNPTDNLEKAIDCCENALKIYTLEAFPQQWATVQSNLSMMFRNRSYGEKPKNLEQALARSVEY